MLLSKIKNLLEEVKEEEGFDDIRISFSLPKDILQIEISYKKLSDIVNLSFPFPSFKTDRDFLDKLLWEIRRG